MNSHIVTGSRGTLTINRALTSDVLDGDTLFLALDRNLLTNGSAPETRFFGCDKPTAAHVYAVQRLEILGDRDPYPPADRFKSTSQEPSVSPDVLSLETAMFVNLFVPKDPADAQPLCPNMALEAPAEPAQRFQQQVKILASQLFGKVVW